MRISINSTSTHLGKLVEFIMKLENDMQALASMQAFATIKLKDREMTTHIHWIVRNDHLNETSREYGWYNLEAKLCTDKPKPDAFDETTDKQEHLPFPHEMPMLGSVTIKIRVSEQGVSCHIPLQATNQFGKSLAEQIIGSLAIIVK